MPVITGFRAQQPAPGSGCTEQPREPAESLLRPAGEKQAPHKRRGQTVWVVQEPWGENAVLPAPAQGSGYLQSGQKIGGDFSQAEPWEGCALQRAGSVIIHQRQLAPGECALLPAADKFPDDPGGWRLMPRNAPLLGLCVTLQEPPVLRTVPTSSADG